MHACKSRQQFLHAVGGDWFIAPRGYRNARSSFHHLLRLLQDEENEQRAVVLGDPFHVFHLLKKRRMDQSTWMPTQYQYHLFYCFFSSIEPYKLMELFLHAVCIHPRNQVYVHRANQTHIKRLAGKLTQVPICAASVQRESARCLSTQGAACDSSRRCRRRSTSLLMCKPGLCLLQGKSGLCRPRKSGVCTPGKSSVYTAGKSGVCTPGRRLASVRSPEYAGGSNFFLFFSSASLYKKRIA